MRSQQSISRRFALKWLASVGVSAGALSSFAFGGSEEPRFTPPPPSEETDPIKQLIDEATTELGEHSDRIGDVLCSPKYMSAHEWPRFRKLIGHHAPTGELTISARPEPGDLIEVTCKVVDEKTKPVVGALVYLYQTSAKGWYSDRAPHYSGNAGDARHARLFGYVRTDDTGTFKLHTIRPGGYPRSDLPQHIHIEATPPDDTLTPRVSEILFEDDSRLSPGSARDRAKRERFVIGAVTHAGDGVARVKVTFELSTMKPKR